MVGSDSPARSAKSRLALALFGLAVSAVAVRWTAQRTDLGAVWAMMRNVSWVYLALTCCIQLSVLFLKAVRCNRILSPAVRMTVMESGRVMMVGFLGNSLLPARLGEVLRVWLLERNYGVRLGTGAGTVIVERYLDMLFILLQFGVAVLFVTVSPALRAGAITLTWIMIVGASVLFVLALHTERMVAWLNRWQAGPPRTAARLVLQLGDGLSILRQRNSLQLVFGLTALIWVLEMLCWFVLMQGFHTGAGLVVAAFVVAVAAMAQVIPSGPGFLGTLQVVAAQAFAVFGLSRTDAVGVSLTLWLLGFTTQVSVGTVAWFQEIKRRPAPPS